MARAMERIHPSSISPFICLFNLFLPFVPVPPLKIIGNKYFSFCKRCIFIFNIFGMLYLDLFFKSFGLCSIAYLTFLAVSTSEPFVQDKGRSPALFHTPISFVFTSPRYQLLLLYATSLFLYSFSII